MSGMENNDEEINLFDLWETLKDGWRWLLACVLLGVLGALTMIFLTPNQYEAVAIVQVGQVGEVGLTGQSGRTGGSVAVEPAAQVVERVKLPAFQLKIAEHIGDQDWARELNYAAASASQRLYPQVIKATSTPAGAALIEIKAKVKSKESALNLVNAAIAELSKKHDELARPQIDRLTLDLKLAKEKLMRTTSELDDLRKLVASSGVKDERSTPLSLMTSLRLQKENELLAAQQIVFGLERALSPPATERTMAIEKAFVGERPVSPKKALFLALGLMGGLLMGVISVFFSSAWRKARERG